MTDIPLNTNVQCSDAPCGKSTNVILNPVTYKVTHMSLEDKTLPDNPTRLVPVSKVTSATPDQITLNCTRDEVVKMDPFIVSCYIQETGEGMAYAYGGAYTSQYVYNDTGYDKVQDAAIPQDDLSVYNGIVVKVSDGEIGKLDELVLDPKSGDITHLQMREGHLWGKKDVAIPMADVEFIESETIYLKIDKEAVKALPAVKVKR